MNLTRRDALRGGTATLAAIAAGGVVTAAASDRDADIAYIEAYARKREELRRGVQALVQEIRQGISGEVLFSSHVDLHEVADRLEALPGIEPVASDWWSPEMRARRLSGKVEPDRLGWNWRDQKC